MASVRKDVAEGRNCRRQDQDPTIDNDTVDAIQDMLGSPEDMEHSHYEAWLARRHQANHNASAFEPRAKQQQAPDLRANFNLNSLNIRLLHAAESTARKHNFRAAACSTQHQSASSIIQLHQANGLSLHRRPKITVQQICVAGVLSSFLLFAFAGIRVMCDEQHKSCQFYHTSHAAGQQTPMSDQPSLTITAVHTSAMPRLINHQLHFTSVQEMVCTIVAEGWIMDNCVRVPSPSSLLYTR
jgi:hypothetical protein